MPDTDTDDSTPLLDLTSPYLQPLNVDSLTQAQEDYVQALLDLACEQVEIVCNRKFAVDDYEEVHNGTGDPLIFVNNPPINTITSIIIDKDEDYEVTIAATNLKFDSLIGEICLVRSSSSTADISHFPEGYQNITINYNGGWTTIPQAIQKIIADMVIEAYNPALIAGNIASERIGQYEYRFGLSKMGKILLSHHSILNRYKIRRVN